MFNHPARLIIPCSSYRRMRLQHIVVSGACEKVCIWLSDRARLKTPPLGPRETTIAKKPRLSILSSRERPDTGKPLAFPKHSWFNCLYLLREINFEKGGMQMCMNKLLHKPISQFNSWELFL